MSAVTHDPVEAGARALTKIRGLIWERISEPWRQEARRQARIVLDAARQALEGGYRHTAEADEVNLFDGGGQP